MGTKSSLTGGKSARRALNAKKHAPSIAPKPKSKSGSTKAATQSAREAAGRIRSKLMQAPPPAQTRARDVVNTLNPLNKKVEKVPPASKSVKNDKIELKVDSKKKGDFRAQDWVVYPAHGVGRIVAVEDSEVAGMKLELFVINFEKDKMTLRVPVSKARTIGMRRLSSPDVVQNALATLKGRARVKRTMWSRRAQEYEQKIFSGDLISIAEVVRDLHRASGQPEQSYSERQLYEAAFARLAREVAAVERIDEDAAMKRLESALLKAA